jgi:hypothetical protein
VAVNWSSHLLLEEVSEPLRAAFSATPENLERFGLGVEREENPRVVQ